MLRGLWFPLKEWCPTLFHIFRAIVVVCWLLLFIAYQDPKLLIVIEIVMGVVLALILVSVFPIPKYEKKFMLSEKYYHEYKSGMLFFFMAHTANIALVFLVVIGMVEISKWTPISHLMLFLLRGIGLYFYPTHPYPQKDY